MARAILLTFAGLAVSSLLIAVGGVVPGLGKGTPEWLSLCLAAALLSFALGWSEFASGAFRAKNALVSGLLPRDVVWRGATIVVVLAVHWVDAKLSALTVTLLSAGILIVVTLPQAFVLLRDTIAAARGPLSPAQKEEFRSVTLGLWGVTALPPALGQMSTLIVAAILGPEAAGAIFVAERATRLVSLALSGINQALAPQISSAFYSGDKPYVQQITSLTALGSLAMALGVSAVFAVFGNFILSIFDPSYATPTMWAVLIVFSLGATISTACGPIEVLLQLTGMQHALLKLLIVVNIVGLGVTALAAYWHGPLGAAASMALTLVIWNVIAVTIASRAIGINPSVVGLVARAGGAKAGSAEASGT